MRAVGHGERQLGDCRGSLTTGVEQHVSVASWLAPLSFPNSFIHVLDKIHVCGDWEQIPFLSGYDGATKPPL